MTPSSISLPGNWNTTRSKTLADVITWSLRQLSGSRKADRESNRTVTQDLTAQVSIQAMDIQSQEKRFHTSMKIIARESPKIHGIVESLWGRAECSEYLQKMILDCSEVIDGNRVGFKVGTVAAFVLLLELHEVQFGASR